MKKCLSIMMVFFSLNSKSQALLGADMNKVGMIRPDGVVLDETDKPTGKFKSDGMVTDKQSIIMGYIKSDGTMQNSSYSTIGYAKDVNKRDAAAAVFFFFFRLN